MLLTLDNHTSESTCFDAFVAYNTLAVRRGYAASLNVVFVPSQRRHLHIYSEVWLYLSASKHSTIVQFVHPLSTRCVSRVCGACHCLRFFIFDFFQPTVSLLAVRTAERLDPGC